jgi:excisionase family DNA binding protein
MSSISNDLAYLSTREAADLLGISIRTAQVWVETGMLEAWKTPGGHRRILRHSVDRILHEKNQIQVQQNSRAVLRVVIVEDDRDLRELMRTFISGLRPELEVLTANDGFEGLLLIGQCHPDMVITDLNLPGMDGFRLLDALGQGHAAPKRLIAVTALSPEDVAQRGALGNNVQILYKPVPISVIEALVLAEYNNLAAL